jgi:hypothetical protein
MRNRKQALNPEDLSQEIAQLTANGDGSKSERLV